MALHLNVVFNIKLWWNILKSPEVCRISRLSASRMSVHFILYRKIKFRTIGGKIWIVGNPSRGPSLICCERGEKNSF
jgi:hypothetical protein